jgi:hypothetical protein
MTSATTASVQGLNKAKMDVGYLNAVFAHNSEIPSMYWYPFVSLRYVSVVAMLVLINSVVNYETNQFDDGRIKSANAIRNNN